MKDSILDSATRKLKISGKIAWIFVGAVSTVFGALAWVFKSPDVKIRDVYPYAASFDSDVVEFGIQFVLERQILTYAGNCVVEFFPGSGNGSLPDASIQTSTFQSGMQLEAAIRIGREYYESLVNGSGEVRVLCDRGVSNTVAIQFVEAD